MVAAWACGLHARAPRPRARRCRAPVSARPIARWWIRRRPTADDGSGRPSASRATARRRAAPMPRRVSSGRWWCCGTGTAASSGRSSRRAIRCRAATPSAALTDAQVVDLTHFPSPADRRHAARLGGIHRAEHRDRRSGGGRGVSSTAKGKCATCHTADVEQPRRHRLAALRARRHAAAHAVPRRTGRPERRGRGAKSDRGDRHAHAAVGSGDARECSSKWTTCS